MIVVAGGGLSGVSAAYFLQKKGIEVLVLEESSAPGGCIRSEVFKNCLLERGPNSLLLSNYLLNIIRELQLQDEILPALPVNKFRYIFKKGKYRKLPSGPGQLLFGNFFSLGTKLKVVKEFFRKPGISGNRDLRSFFEAHFGKEIVEYAVSPFVSGIYAGDPSQLLVEETFPVLLKYEKENGSLLKGIIKNAGVRKKLVTFKNGLNVLPSKMAEYTRIEYNSKVCGIEKKNKALEIVYNQNGQEKRIEANGCILSLPAWASAEILEKQYPSLSRRFSAIEYVPMTIVHSIYKKKNIENKMDGFGALNPRIENRFSAGSIWTSSVFPSRTPSDMFLFTTFVGGKLLEQQANQPDEVIKREVHQELREAFGIDGDPEFQRIFRWSKALPQYNQKVAEIRATLEELEKENIYSCSNVFGGVSMEDCIRKGEQISEKIKLRN